MARDSIVKLKREGVKNHLYYDFYIGEGKHKKRHHKSTKTGNEKKAHQIANELHEQLWDEYYLGIKGSITLEEAIINFLDSKTNIKPKTLKDNQLYCNRLVGKKLIKSGYDKENKQQLFSETPVTGGLNPDIELQKIDSQMLDKMQQTLENENLSAESVRKQLLTLRAIIDLANRYGYRTNKQLIFRKQSRGQSKAIHLMDGEEELILNALDKSCNPENKLYFLFLADTGCRSLEGRRVRWSDLNKGEDGRYVSVKITRAKQKSNRGTNQEQSVTSIVPLTSRLSNALHNAFKRSDEWVFTNQACDDMRGKDDSWLKVAVERAGLNTEQLNNARGGKISPHVLRHTYVYKLLNHGKGMSLESIAVLVGHSDVQTTRVYSSWCETSVGVNALEILERLND